MIINALQDLLVESARLAAQTPYELVVDEHLYQVICAEMKLPDTTHHITFQRTGHPIRISRKTQVTTILTYPTGSAYVFQAAKPELSGASIQNQVTSCKHEFVNQGFSSLKMVCKKCNQEQV